MPCWHYQALTARVDIKDLSLCLSHSKKAVSIKQLEGPFRGTRDKHFPIPVFSSE